jgi:hypothetical protein
MRCGKRWKKNELSILVGGDTHFKQKAKRDDEGKKGKIHFCIFSA